MWIAIGLAGLVLAAALQYATNKLMQPKIGLVSEPVYAGEALAPPRTATSASENESADGSRGDSSGKGRGRGRVAAESSGRHRMLSTFKL